MKHVVKRLGNLEPCDQRKLYASIYAACSSLQMSSQEAELISEQVSRMVESTIELKKVKEVSSSQIFRAVIKHLKAINPEAAYIYQNHRSAS
jgi:transcriptional regulator NrdR family protein